MSHKIQWGIDLSKEPCLSLHFTTIAYDYRSLRLDTQTHFYLTTTQMWCTLGKSRLQFGNFCHKHKSFLRKAATMEALPGLNATSAWFHGQVLCRHTNMGAFRKGRRCFCIQGDNNSKSPPHNYKYIRGIMVVTSITPLTVILGMLFTGCWSHMSWVSFLFNGCLPVTKRRDKSQIAKLKTE